MTAGLEGEYMKIFVTGATGFIGMHLVRRLAETKHDLYCLVRRTSDVSTIKEVGATLIPGDVTDKASILAGIRGCDSVINLANVYTFWEPRKRIYRDVNVDGTRNIMECALETGVSKVVHISSAVIYGMPADCPFTEESRVGPVRFSEYARTKYAGDLVVWDLFQKRHLPVVVVYPGAVLGPGDPKTTGQYIQSLMHRRMPATVFPDSVLTCVHVRDVAEVIARALEKQANIGEKYLAGKDRVSFREINQAISQISGVPLPKMQMPDALAVANAWLLTGLANITKKPPMLGMSIDMARTMKYGFRFDGSKAERELGITYTPVGVALEEAIASYRH